MGEYINTPFKSRDGQVVERPNHEIWVSDKVSVEQVKTRIMRWADTDSLYVDLACIGADTVNTAVKAIARARGELLGVGLDLVSKPFFSVITDNSGRERTRTMIRLELEDIPE